MIPRLAFAGGLLALVWALVAALREIRREAFPWGAMIFVVLVPMLGCAAAAWLHHPAWWVPAGECAAVVVWLMMARGG